VSDSMNTVWCLVANVSRDPHPEGTKRLMRLGTKHFASGELVYCFPPLWSDWTSRLRVIGRRKGGSRLVETVVSTKHLTDWRPERVSDPEVVEALWDSWDDTEESRDRAEKMAKTLVAHSLKHSS
jgi:hypothetical protein